ncbi:MAG: sigma-54 dependent transcriptional regulator [Gemmataceae bacterium]
MVTPPRVLLLSRDPVAVEAIERAKPDGGLQLVVSGDAKDATARLRAADYAVLLIHLTPGEVEPQVLPLLRVLTNTRQNCATLVLAGQLGEDQVAALLRLGVADCLLVPADLARLPLLLEELFCLTAPEAMFDANAGPGMPEDPFDAFTPDMAMFSEQVRRVAPQEATVLLTGETGTGKTRLARLIHELSPRRDQPFLVVDCGSLSASLIESELFGHARGAFTGADRERQGKLAAAGGGTLLLDEVNSLPLPLQSKLLRAVDERVYEPVGSEKSQPVKARLIAASNVPLEAEVAAARFRGDLFFRLNVVGFYLPALRDRRACVGPLALRFLKEFAARNRPDVMGFSRETRRALQEYDWPGNVRELRNAVVRAAALCLGPEIQVEDLPAPLQANAPGPPAFSTSEGEGYSELCAVAQPTTLALSKQEVEVRRILETLQKHKDNRLRAAAELGISRVALYKKLHKYGLMTPRYQKNEDGPQR